MKRIHSFLIALALFFAGHSLALAAPDSLPLPGYARITYRVSYGEGGVQVGSSIQELRHDGVRYAMRSHMETTGIFWLLKPVQMTNVSKGEIVAGGFRPNEFSVTRFNGKNETAAFDWAANEVRRDNGERYPLEAGTQDMLSMFWQLALLPLNGATVSLPVATGKGVELYEFTIVGRETLDLPLGAVATVHLANRQPSSKESTDLWLALEKDKLPVRMRFIDRKGNVFDQLAESIALEEKEGKR